MRRLSAATSDSAYYFIIFLFFLFGKKKIWQPSTFESFNIFLKLFLMNQQKRFLKFQYKNKKKNSFLHQYLALVNKFIRNIMYGP